MAAKKKIVVIIEKTETGFSAYAADYPVYTTGSNMTEVTDNIKEAFTLYFDKRINLRGSHENGAPS